MHADSINVVWCIYLGSSRVAVLNPTQVYCTKTVSGDSCEPMVIIFVNVGIKCGVKVNIVSFSTTSQTLLHGLISKPLLQFRGSDHIVNNTLKIQSDFAFESFINLLLFSIKSLAPLEGIHTVSSTNFHCRVLHKDFMLRNGVYFINE